MTPSSQSPLQALRSETPEKCGDLSRYDVLIRLVATNKGMVEALQLVAHGSSELKTYSFDRLTTAIAMLLDRGVTAGVFRSDVSPEELLWALVGIFYSQSAEKWQPGAVRLVNVFVDGLCNSTSRKAPRRR